MKLKDFFDSEPVSLPRAGFDETRETFHQFLDALLGKYVKQLQLIDDPDLPEICSERKQLATAAGELAASILTSVQLSLAGHPNLAYKEISDALSRIDWGPFSSQLMESNSEFNPSDPYWPLFYAIKHPSLYRIRSDRSEFTIPSRGDIFHVPFEKRRLVSNQRYSITGLPCLYLGGSLWICWEELGRPPLDSVLVSRFRIVGPVSVLDFQFPPHHMWRFFADIPQETSQALDNNLGEKLRDRFSLAFLRSYIMCWPLIAACSIKRDQRTGSFFPEYIVPQLLLQWVAEGARFDGIRYFSVRMPSRGAHVLAHSNCVFPAKMISFKGHCAELKKRFALTEPLSWEALTVMRLKSPRGRRKASSNAFSTIQMNRDILLPYCDTAFFDVEARLEQIEAKPNCSRVIDR